MADHTPTPTPEQAEVTASYGDGVDLVIQAGAGAGKSYTLKMVAKSDPQRRMMYVAYNKSIATEAQRSFPSNTTCATAHSLAFHAVGRDYAHRLNGPRQSSHAAAQILDVPRITNLAGPARMEGDDGKLVALASRQIMRLALETVTRYCYSADAEISLAHLPSRPNLKAPQTRQAIGELVLPVARAAWADLCATAGRLAFQHDHYLKLWALSGPKLPTDVVLLDEGQDTNRVLAALVQAQDHAQRIVVGDSAQQIYEWRGASDALARFAADGATELTLSKSFRFGPMVADTANVWLDLLDAPIRLTGHDPIESRLESPLLDPDAVLCRTNAGAMSVVMDRLAAGGKVALVGGGSDVQRLARAAAALMRGEETDHPELIAFATWDQVREYAEEEPDGADLRVLVQLVDDHGTEAILAATERLVDERTADTVVSTAHRSKGREWPRVRIHNDFRAPNPDRKTRQVLVRREEARLAYVAVTRARQVLDASALAWVHTVDGVAE